jgi:hypothetical protein
MASVFSIENINLNGDILTANNGSLYINNNLIKNTSGVQLSDRFFIKGYAPISFYSKWPQQGNYLNETYLNDFFMATGVLVTCSQPTTGTQTFFGGLYERPASSAINTSVFANFELAPEQIIQHAQINYKVEKNSIIGLNIYNAPEDMRSLSVHLLGYFPAAAHFDRMPKQINFYAKNIPIFSENIHEEYNQWDSVFSGFGVYCSNTGIDQLTFAEQVTGYISGFVSPEPVYAQSLSILKTPCNPCENQIDISDWSGYILNNNKINFPATLIFSGFSGQPDFSSISGFQYTGFQISSNGIFSNGIYSGYSDSAFGSGEILQNIGWRSGAFPEKVSGFLSGYLNQYGGFLRLSKITTGVSGSGVFYDNNYDPYRGIDSGIFKLDLSGFIIGSSGYFIDGKKYFFPADRPISYNIVGFISGYMDPIGRFTGFQNLNAISGSSGYYINTLSDYVQVFFPTGNNFNNFIGMYGIYTGSGYSSYHTGFTFPLGSGFSGIGGSTLDTYGIMTGIIGAANIFIPFSGFSGRPNIDIGLGFEYTGMHFDINEDFFSGLVFDGSGYTGQWIGGVGKRNVSGKQDITGFSRTNALYNFQIISGLPSNTSGISGYFIDNNTYMFPSGTFDPKYYKFPKFDNNPSFTKYGYSYSGFYPSTSGFSGIGFTGVVKEYIVGFISGFKNVFGEFYQFDQTTGSSGFITGNQKSFFPTGSMFSGFTGFSGFNNNLGFLYTGFGPYPYIGNNFIGDTFINSGSGIITGYIGWRNVNFVTKEYGTGIMTGIIGYRNTPYSGSFTGNFYHKDKNGNKVIGPKFGLKTGQLYNESFNIGFNVPWNNRIGIDIYNPLSGISDINIVLFGYYE